MAKVLGALTIKHDGSVIKSEGGGSFSPGGDIIESVANDQGGVDHQKTGTAPAFVETTVIVDENTDLDALNGIRDATIEAESEGVGWTFVGTRVGEPLTLENGRGTLRIEGPPATKI